ncbi:MULTISPECIES: hypothetical protein [Serratia]|uniref:hypothetical protein n=1 Tax=Serratia TaxID=613 RepID=UPI0022038547|nr:hypothetical protein [Serratia marcescens]MDQ9443440.1 hypothetical protein [Serratia marcescens]USQ51199.1 hypothetical protein NFX37_10255 [Serratia marcescens]UYU10852.1 hypothetical protein OHZ00_09380 [Serratia marcescens]
MKNIVENQDIKTDKPLPMSYEALKAERDALADRVNALAVENAALKDGFEWLYAVVSSDEVSIPDEKYSSVTNAAAVLSETPATSAALAAIQAQAVEDAVTQVLSVDTIAFTAVISHLLRTYAANIQEAK